MSEVSKRLDPQDVVQPGTIGRIDGRVITSSGTIVTQSGQETDIYPFHSESDGFTLRVQFEFNDGIERPTITVRADEDDDKLSYILIKRRFSSGDFSASGWHLFASEDNFHYYFTAAISILGTFDRYTAIIHYTVTRGGRDE